MIGLVIISLIPVALIVGGIACAISNWRNGVQVGNER